MGTSGRPVDVRVLGGVRARVGGEEISLSPKQASTLAVLVAAGADGLSKDELYEELYGDDPQGSGSQAAVMRIHRLRQKLDAADVSAITPAPRYSLDRDACSVDAWSIVEDFRSDDPRVRGAAIERWSEPFIGIETEPPVIVTARESLRRRFRACLVRSAWTVDVGVQERLVDVLLDETATDVHDEQLAVATAAALYRLGRQPAALDLLTSCRDRLRADFGLEATPHFDEMELAILRHDDSVLSTRGTEKPRRSAARLVSGGAALPEPRHLVGRQVLVDELDDVVREHRLELSARPGSVYALVGPAGVGKTSLIATVVSPHVDAGLTVRVGRPGGGDRRRSDRGVFDALLEAVPELQREVDSSLDVDRGAAPGGRRVRAWRRLHARLCDVAGEAPTVLVLEDLHDADSQTLDFLRFFISSARPPGLLVILTARPPGGPEEPDVIAGLGDPAAVTVRSMPALTREDVRELVAFDHPEEPPVVRERFASDVHRLSQGNALVASVLSRDALPGLGSLLVTGTQNHVESLAQHLDRKVTDAELRQLLSVAGVIGTEFDLDVLAAVVDGSTEDVRLLLQDARTLAVCTPIDRSRWRFDHPLTASHFADQLRLLRPTLSARLAILPGLTPVETVRHVATSGDALDAEVARRLLRVAAGTLEEQRAFAEGAIALSMLAELTTGADRSAVLVRLAASESRRGDLDAARAARARAFDAYRTADDHDGMYAAATAGLPSGEYSGGEVDRLEMLDEVDFTRLQSVGPAEFARWKLRFARLCDRPSVVRSVIDAIDPSWRDDDDPAWLTLEVERISALASASDARLARRDLEELSARTGDDPLGAEVLHRCAVAALVEQDQDVVAAYERSLAVTRVGGVARTRWASDVLAATLALSGIRPSSADAAATRRSGLRWGIPDLVSTWGVQVWMEHWIGGDVVEAARVLAQMQTVAPSNVAWEAAAVLCLAATGQLDDAARRARDVADDVRRNPDGVWVPVGAALLVEASRVLGDADTAEVAAAVLGPRSGQAIVLGLGAAHFGPADRYLGIAAGLAGDGDGSRRLLTAAAEQADRCGATTWVALIDRDLGPVRT